MTDPTAFFSAVQSDDHATLRRLADQSFIRSDHPTLLCHACNRRRHETALIGPIELCLSCLAICRELSCFRHGGEFLYWPNQPGRQTPVEAGVELVP